MWLNKIFKGCIWTQSAWANFSNQTCFDWFAFFLCKRVELWIRKQLHCTHPLQFLYQCSWRLSSRKIGCMQLQQASAPCLACHCDWSGVSAIWWNAKLYKYWTSNDHYRLHRHHSHLPQITTNHWRINSTRKTVIFNVFIFSEVVSYLLDRVCWLPIIVFITFVVDICNGSFNEVGNSNTNFWSRRNFFWFFL